ncbi:TauD/TfdA family dioxygenase [Leptolyngbya sp. FACHB-261]|uniref:TauD/TfdA dioxygenase family protein n=1 Tax=Leptolyngbya sp. FACHB-261 TaxID=2692806 RepID=UPI00168741A4|nr:TauD/TfdA family dioxygenase [Leptolyngbya sp. FACHB-261]MBD2100288.1 TauD/TfdA family dioxygenase [Leptolyngbya sp. FACHB-261]
MTAAELTIIPTGGALGAIVTDLDTSRPVSSEIILRLKQALRDHHILIFKHQTLSEAQLLEFATYFGDVFVPPENVPVLGSKPGNPPLVVTIANAAPEYGSGGALLDNVELLPHTDHQWAPRPSSGSLLYALEVPERGGDTQWANLIKAYEELDAGTKEEIANLQLITYNPFLEDEESGNVTATYHSEKSPCKTLNQTLFSHPLVRTHPESGRKVLYLDRAYEVEVVGMEAKTGAELIERLRKHISQPQFYYNHRWSVGDIVYWDNQCTLHYRPAFEQTARRVMKRVSLAGSRPF